MYIYVFFFKAVYVHSRLIIFFSSSNETLFKLHVYSV